MKGSTNSPTRREARYFSDSAVDQSCWDRLTNPEWRLVWLTASCWEDREIAKSTGETPLRVKARLRALLDKLGLENRLALILAVVAADLQIPSHARRPNEEGTVSRRAS